MSEQSSIPPQPQADPSMQQPGQQPYQQPGQQPYQPAQQQWQQPMQQPFDQQAYRQQWQQHPQAQQPYQQQWQQPYGNPYGQPAPDGQPAQPSKLAPVALVCGILAIVFSLCIFIGIVQTVVGIVLGSLGIVAGVAAIVLAVLAMKKSPSRKATVGLVCGIVGVVLGVVLIPASLMAIYPAAQGGLKGSSSSKSHTTSLADEINGEVIKDDEVATITLGKMEFDADGNLVINYKMTNNINDSGVEITLKDKTGSAWELNGQKVECSCLAWAKSGKTVDNTIIIPASYIDFDDVDEVESLSGLLIYDLSPGHIEGEVHVDLYVR